MARYKRFPAHVVLVLISLLLTGLYSADPITAEEPTVSAAWELRMLGVDLPDKLSELRAFPKKRQVRLGVVGQNGVSRKHLERFLRDGSSIVYHECQDPNANTHDTQMSRVIFEITSALGVGVELHAWQAGPSFQDYGDKFRQAGDIVQIVSLYQSFWGEQTPVITESIGSASKALFISPYVEHGGHPTNVTPQGRACRPWDEDTIGHFVTVAPLARRHARGTILTPSDREPTDSEAINFVAPSYHANGPGGTCPAAAVAVACAVYLYAVHPDKPQPDKVIALMRETSTIDRIAMVSKDRFTAAAIDQLESQIATMRKPVDDRQRKLDSPGVLNLYQAFKRLCGPAS